MTSGPGALIAGQYRLVEELGRGGFGVVWRARDERLHRDVAAKELFPLTYLGHDQWRERQRRGLREARSAARIGHPGAVTVYDVAEHDGSPWIIMELVDGRALNAVVRRDGPLTPRRAARIGLEILGALRAAHAAGVVHRDVKPGNVLVGERRAVLTDFGIATIEGDPVLTHSGFVMGAPAYTAPERARGEPAVPESDLWSLGATLFYAVEGHRPYPGANANATFHAILNCDPPVPGHAGPLIPVITGLMRRDVADRLTAAQATVMLQQIVGLPADAEQAPADAEQVPAVARPPAHRRVGPVHRLPARAERSALAAAMIALAVGAGTVLWPYGLGGADPVRSARHLNAAVLGSGPSTTLVRTPAGLNAVTFSPDGDLLAAAGEDGTVRLFGVAGRGQITVLTGHRGPVLAVSFSPDGRTLASGGHDGKVILWDARRHRRLAAFSPGPGAIGSVGFSPDGRLLAGAGGKGVRVWDTTTRSPVQTFTDRPGPFVAAFGVHPAPNNTPEQNEQSAPSTPAAPNSPTGSAPNTPAGPDETARPDGMVVAGPETVRIWRPGRRQQIAALGRVTSPVRALAVSPDGATIACGDDGGRVILWEVRARTRTAQFDHDGGVHAIAFSPDGRTLASAAGSSVTLWDVRSRTRTRTLTGHAALVGSVAYSPDGRSLATAGHDRTIRLWTTATS